MSNKIIYCKSPLRLSLAGGGTDVEPFSSKFESCVLNFTINEFIEGSLKELPPNDLLTQISVMVATSSGFGAKNSNRVPSDFEVLLEQNLIAFYGNRIKQPIAITLSSPVSPGSGLGASSSMVLTAIHLLKVHLSEPVNPYLLAHEAFELERNWMHLSGGFQDQYAAAFGGVLFLSRQTLKVQVEKLKVQHPFLRSLENSILLIDLGISRSGETIIDKQIKNVHLEKFSTISALIKQIAIAKEMRSAILDQNLPEVARLVQEAWESKKDFTLEISNETINNTIKTLIDLGAIGVKVSGAGGGGHLLCILPEDSGVREKTIGYLRHSRLDYRKIRISGEGSSAWTLENGNRKSWRRF